MAWSQSDFTNIHENNNEFIYEVAMKRKPDAMLALIVLFFIGLIASGFSSLTVGSGRPVMDHAVLVYPVEETSRP
jgi:hypothetical protein